MAYYAALISLKKTIQRLLDPCQISILPHSREILEYAFQGVRSFQEFLQNNEEMMIKNGSNERLKSLNGQVAEAAYKLEDALESQVLNQSEISIGSDEGSTQQFFLDLEEVKEEINSFVETVKKIEKMMMEELTKPLPEEDDDDIVVPSKLIDFGGKNTKMVGLSENFSKIKDKLINDLSSKDCVVPIVGMAGIGKTTLAMKIFQDPSISSHFDTRVFVTIGVKYRFRKVMLSILAQMNRDINEVRAEEDEKLAEHISFSLQGRRCLIVLDDVWNTKVLEELMSLFPMRHDNRVLLTTRLFEVALYRTGLLREEFRDVAMNLLDFAGCLPFLSKTESWDLLREKVFGEGNSCPYQLQKFGKKIAKNCEGLPLTIVTVANILSKGENTSEHWKKTAERKNSVFTDAYDQMSEVLMSSYNYLPQHLKPLFLYMAVFPRSYKIRPSKLDKLWHLEELIDEPNPVTSFFGKHSLLHLISSSIVLPYCLGSTKVVKIAYLSSAYWHLCAKEAGKDKFLHVINRYASSFTKDTESQRRLCVHNNVLFGIKEVHNSMKSISMARSLLCTGPYHQYPVPMCFDFRLLRVLDALTIRFYKFPIEVLKLVQLRYLALTYSGKVPGSISKLWKLEHLIVRRHLSINKSSKGSSYLPIEIWNMKELRHIQVTGGNLHDPCGARLASLLVLSDMSVNICSREILERTPSLRKLGIQIELSPDAVEPLCSFDHLSHLHCLRSLQCVVVNPKPKSHVVPYITTFPTQLMKLSLSGLGYPWEYMRTIGKLPNLEVLKLRCYAFQGPFWRIYRGEFSKLRHLLIKDTDLVSWRGDHENCLESLKRLFITHCYKLKEIPSTLISRTAEPSLSMTVVDCPSCEAFVQQLRASREDFRIYVHSSVDDEEIR